VVVWWTDDRLRPVVEFKAQGGLAPRMALSPDGRVLYIAAANAITIWSTETGQELAPRMGFTAPVAQVAWTANGQRVIGAQGPHLGAWDVATRMPVQAGNLSKNAYGMLDLQVLPNGDLLATDWSGFTLYAGDTYAERYHRFTGRAVRASAFSPDGGLLATGGAGPFVNV
jgi:WD40 repeat protein